MSSSMETNVPAKVPRKRPYLSVSFKAATIASPFVTTSSFLTRSIITNTKNTLVTSISTSQAICFQLFFFFFWVLPLRFFSRQSSQDREECEASLEARSDREPLRRSDEDSPQLLKLLRRNRVDDTPRRRRQGKGSIGVFAIGRCAVVIVKTVDFLRWGAVGFGGGRRHGGGGRRIRKAKVKRSRGVVCISKRGAKAELEEKKE